MGDATSKDSPIVTRVTLFDPRHRLVGVSQQRCVTSSSGKQVRWSGDVPVCQSKYTAAGAEQTDKKPNAAQRDSDRCFPWERSSKAKTESITTEMGSSLSVPFLGSVCVLQTPGAAAAPMLKATLYVPAGIVCDPPPDVPHGRHNGHLTDTFSYADVVTYTCDPGHLLAGEPSIFCTTADGEHGVWSGPPPRCGGRALRCVGVRPCRQGCGHRGTIVPSSPLLQEPFGTRRGWVHRNKCSYVQRVEASGWTVAVSSSRGIPV